MFGVLCARPKSWFLTSASIVHGGWGSAAHHRIIASPIKHDQRSRYHHSTSCNLSCAGVGGGAASIWHVILPASGRRVCKRVFHHEQKGEGSWNVAWDARPARWLHHPDSAWLLFGVCACLAAPVEFPEPCIESVTLDEVTDRSCRESIPLETNGKNSANYRVTGVPADGRCLFRAIAHMTCLRNGEEAPDEDRQREVADELRAQVVDELVKRRKETEWFIEGDFDAYVERIQQPYVWGGEPELLMASHVLKTMISVYMLDKCSGSLSKIANYGEEYQNEKETPIKVLFHGYGHYDILETNLEESCHKSEAL